MEREQIVVSAYQAKPGKQRCLLRDARDRCL
jgi:hypothetical protein